jgi:hypothetical protein
MTFKKYSGGAAPRGAIARRSASNKKYWPKRRARLLGPEEAGRALKDLLLRGLQILLGRFERFLRTLVGHFDDLLIEANLNHRA